MKSWLLPEVLLGFDDTLLDFIVIEEVHDSLELVCINVRHRELCDVNR